MLTAETRSPINSPIHDQDTNPRRWYLDGILANFVNPIFALTARPPGGLGVDFSTIPDTGIDQPTASVNTLAPMPGTRFNPYDPMPNLAMHDPSNIDTSEPRTFGGLSASETHKLPGNNFVGGITGLVDRATVFFSGSPVAAIFIGLAGLLIFNAAILKSGSINRAGSRTGRSVANVGSTAATGAENTGKSVMDAANAAAGSVVEIAEGRK